MSTSNRHRASTTILGASLLTTMGTLPVFLLASQSVLIRDELGFGERRFGIAVAAFFASAAICAIFGGKAADRVGRRASTVLAGIVAGIGGLGVALVAHNWALLVAFVVLLGAANAACQVTSNLTLARVVPAHRRGIGFGVKQAAVPLAIVLAGLAVPTVTASLGWRSTFLLCGVAGLGVALLAAVRSQTHAASPRVPSGHGRDLPPLAPLIVAMLAVCLGSAAANSLAAFLPSWGFQIGLSVSQTGLLLAVGSALNIAGRLLAGFLADRREGRNLPVVAAQLLIGGIAVAIVSVPIPAVVVPAAVAALAIGWSWPGLMLYAVVRIGRDSPAGASGLVQAGAFAGGAAGPLIFGFLVEAIGYQHTWHTAAVALLLAAGLVHLARRMFVADLRRRPPREPITYGGTRANPQRTPAPPTAAQLPAPEPEPATPEEQDHHHPPG